MEAVKILRGITINKKTFIVVAVLIALVLGGELLLPVIEEVGILALEWVHKTLDIFYEDVLGLQEETAKKASAWTGFFLIAAIVIWACVKLYQQFLRMKAAFPQWWLESKAGLNSWWASLSITNKLVVVILVIGVLGMLAMVI